MVLFLPLREVQLIVHLIGAAARPGASLGTDDECDVAASVLARVGESLKARDRAMRETS